MKALIKFPLKLNLQFFAADGGAGAAGGDGGSSGASGVTAGASLPANKGVDLANVVYGKQASSSTDSEALPEADDLNAEFESLIKGKYKAQYDQRVQDTVQKRLKNTKETVDKYNALTPTLELLAKKYGVTDPTDVASINKAIEEDDSYYEDEALERGISVEQLKSIRKMERENAALRQEIQQKEIQENSDRIYASLLEQEKQLKAIYPSFVLKNELQNQQFRDLVSNNIDVKTAFEVVHHNEILPAAMQFTAQQVKKGVAQNIMANGVATENGLSSSSPAVVKSDPSQLTNNDIAEICRRVQRGERISF